MTAALAMVVLAMGPPVQLEIEGLNLPEAELQQLHGQILTRLVEAGESVGRPGAAILRLTGGDASVRVELQHGRQLLERTVAAPPGGVQRLAVIHAALELLEELEASNAPVDPDLDTDAERRVVIETTEQAQHELATAIAAAVEAGLVVTADGPGAYTLCVDSDAQGQTSMVLVRGDAPCVDDGQTELTTGNIIEAATALAAVSEAGEAVPPTATKPEPEPEPELRPDRPGEPTSARRATQVPSGPRASAPSAAWTFVVGAGGGVQGRLRSAEGLVDLEAGARAAQGPVVLVRTAFSPSRAGGVSAYDTFTAAAFGWHWSVGKKVAFQAVGGAGVYVHTFAFGDERGRRADLNLEVAPVVSVALGRRLELVAGPRLGWTPRAREHLLADGTVAWSRDRTRIGGTAGLRFIFPPTGNPTLSRRPKNR